MEDGDSEKQNFNNKTGDNMSGFGYVVQPIWDGYFNQDITKLWDTLLDINFIILPACGSILWLILLLF